MVGCAQRNTGGHLITSMANTFLSAYGGMMGVAFLSGSSLMGDPDPLDDEWSASDANIKLVIFASSLVNASKIHAALKPLKEVFDNEILAQIIDVVYQLYRAHWAVAGISTLEMEHIEGVVTQIKRACHYKCLEEAHGGIDPKVHKDDPSLQIGEKICTVRCTKKSLAAYRIAHVEAMANLKDTAPVVLDSFRPRPATFTMVRRGGDLHPLRAEVLGLRQQQQERRGGELQQRPVRAQRGAYDLPEGTTPLEAECRASPSPFRGPTARSRPQM